jgi:hypothetical protein
LIKIEFITLNRDDFFRLGARINETFETARIGVSEIFCTSYHRRQSSGILSGPVNPPEQNIPRQPICDDAN